MAEQIKRPAWMEDELVQNIPAEKLDFLSQMFTEADMQRQAAGERTDQRTLMLRLMPLLKRAKAANLGFTPQEMQAAIAAIRKHSTPKELSEIEKILEKNKGTGAPPS